MSSTPEEGEIFRLFDSPELVTTEGIRYEVEEKFIIFSFNDDEQIDLIKVMAEPPG